MLFKRVQIKTISGETLSCAKTPKVQAMQTADTRHCNVIETSRCQNTPTPPLAF